MSMLECLSYGTERCETCSEGMRKYCKLKHQKLQDGTFNLAKDYWDYIELVVEDDDDEIWDYIEIVIKDDDDEI